MKKISYIVAASAIAMLPAMSGYAANEVPLSDVAAMEFTRTVSGVTNTFANSFGYEIVASEDNPAEVVGLADSFTIDFATTDAILENSVFKTASVDLSGVQFSKLGDYEFVVREVSSTDPVNFPVDSENEYVLVASVRNALNDAGEQHGELVGTFAGQDKNAYGNKTADADFEKSAVRGKIQISNTLQGSMSDSGAYFKYKVEFVGAKEGDVFTISGQDAEVNYGGETITTANSFVVGQDNYIYLKHGQTATIGQNGELNELPVGLQYSVIELDAVDYETYIDGEVEEDKSVDSKVVQADLAEDASEEEIATYKQNNVTEFVNKKEANVLTGVALSILPFAIAGSLGLAGYAMSRKNTKD